MGTDKYHIQVSHHLRVGKNALNEYDQYAIYLAILYHGAIDMFSVLVTYSRSNSVQKKCNLFPAQQSHTYCHSSNISLVIRGYMPVAGSFIRVTGKESADFAAASAF